jgi:hypothetical protein
MNRSVFVRAAVAVAAVLASLPVIGCVGQRSFFGGRPFPPSTILQRVLVAIQNPSLAGKGTLQIVDARYDIRNSEDGKTAFFFVSGFGGALPTMIFNYPEEQRGYVYGSGDGSLSVINYSTESKPTTYTGLVAGVPNGGVYVTADGNYAIGANQPDQFLTVIDRVRNVTVNLNLPNTYKVAGNPDGSVLLAFVQNSDYAYRVIHLQQPNGTIAPVPTFPNEANWPKAVNPVDCQPIATPVYCVVPVLDQHGNPIQFDRPYNTIFSADGTTAWVLNCGPECGNPNPDPVTTQATASVSFLNVGVLDVYNFPGSTYPTPPAATPPPTESARVAIPGGATMAVYGNGNLYISGQQVLTQGPQAGLLEGFLSILNLGTLQVTGQYPISDGTHTKMLFGDDNTLWIGSQTCQEGYRTATNQVNGCLTMFTLTNNSVLVEPWYGDLTGLCAIIEWHKVYTAYGGQLHIYATANSGITTLSTTYSAGSELYNGDVTVTGTAYDVAYMDALTNAQD